MNDAAWVQKVPTGMFPEQEAWNVEALLNDNLDELPPVIIDRALSLISGKRRVEAFRKAGRDYLPAIMVDPSDLFSEWSHFRQIPVLSDRVQVVRHARELKLIDHMHDRVAKLFKSYGEWSRALRVVEAAEADPEKFHHLLVDMDQTGGVTRSYKAVIEATGLKRPRPEPTEVLDPHEELAGGKDPRSPARHKVHYRARRFDSSKAISKAVITLEGVEIGLADLVVADIDPAERAGYASRLGNTIRKLKAVQKELLATTKEESSDRASGEEQHPADFEGPGDNVSEEPVGSDRPVEG